MPPGEVHGKMLPFKAWASSVTSLLSVNNLSEKFFIKNANIPKLRRAKVGNTV